MNNNIMNNNNIIKCLENNDMATMIKIMSESTESISFNFTDEEIYTIFKNSCIKDSVLAFKTLHSNLKDCSIIYKNDNSLLKIACLKGAHNIVKWIHSLGHINLSINSYDYFFNACFSNNSELILWLHNNIKSEIDYHKDNDILMRTCAKNNLVDSVILLLTFTKFSMSIAPEYNDRYRFENIFHFFCRYGYIDLAKAYMRTTSFNINSKENEAICLACQEGHLKMVKWLYSIGGTLDSQNNWCFDIGISRGNIDLLKWIYSLGKINIHDNNDYMFRIACSLGKLEVAKWIYSLGDIDVHASADYAFISSCMDNHVEVAKWLYSFGDINLYYDNNVLMKVICQTGNLDIFQWLVSLDNFSIHQDNEIFFRIACNLDHLELAKWIYNLGNINIKAQKNEAFKFACSNNNILMATWLKSINQTEYFFEVVDYNISNWYIAKVIKIFDVKEVEEISECPICLTGPSDIITSCNHQFCRDCFKRYVEKQDDSMEDISCPYCRTINLKFHEIKKSEEK